MPTTIWTGSISFGLVTVPVKLTPATKSRDVSFNQLEEDTGSRIRLRRVSEQTGEEVTPDKIVKGYEIEKGRYVVVEKSELDSLAPEGEPHDRDRGLRRPRRHRPDLLRLAVLRAGRREGGEAVQAARRRDDRAAEGRDRSGGDPGQGAARRDPAARRDAVRRDDALRRRGRGPRQARGIPGDEIERQRARARDGDAARRDARRATSSPTKYHDEYREQLLGLIDQKAAGEEIVAQPEPEAPAKVLDLMAALEASLKRAGRDDGAPRRRRRADDDDEVAARAVAAKSRPRKARRGEERGEEGEARGGARRHRRRSGPPD